MRGMVKWATLVIPALLALGPCVKADAVDNFSVDGGLFTFNLPSTVTPTPTSLNIPGYLRLDGVPVNATTPQGLETIDFTIYFLPLANDFTGTYNFVMNCPLSENFVFCAGIGDIGLLLPSDPFTISNGQLTFIPGTYPSFVFGPLVITAGPVATPEPGTLLLMGSGLVGLGLRKRRFPRALHYRVDQTLTRSCSQLAFSSMRTSSTLRSANVWSVSLSAGSGSQNTTTLPRTPKYAPPAASTRLF